MYTTIQKWGNSNAVRIPKHITDKLNLKENDPIELVAENDAIVIRKSRKHIPFAERMAGYDGHIIFTELDSGEQIGREEF